MGHSRPMHSVPVPINVRCYSNIDVIVLRSEVTLRAICRHQPIADAENVRFHASVMRFVLNYRLGSSSNLRRSAANPGGRLGLFHWRH